MALDCISTFSPLDRIDSEYSNAEVVVTVVLPLTKVLMCLFALGIMYTGRMRWLLYAGMTGLIATNGS